MSGIVWLASYPKSGNTWFRSFLTNLLRDADEPADINDLEGGPIASARPFFDEAVGYDSGDLTPDEADPLRPEVYAEAARAADGALFLKVHDACVAVRGGGLLFPPEATVGALYFVRNPLDVCVSLTHHNGHADFDRTIRQMADPDSALSKGGAGQPLQLRQRLLTWSGHVASWVDQAALRVHVVRFEDMKLRPEETFTAAAHFAGLPESPDRVRKAIAFSRFEELKRQEEKHGFHERVPRSPSFFRKGEVGCWRGVLSAAQVAQVVESHAVVMRRFGYLDEQGRIPSEA